MTHRLGFRGYVLLWAVAIFYVLMFLTSPTEVGPATVDLIKGIVGAADAAGEGVGQVHDDLQRQALEDDIRHQVEQELRDEGWTNPDSEPVEQSSSRYHGPAEVLEPERLWARLHAAHDVAEDRLDRLDQRLSGQGSGS
jgi:hypothetical protein